MMRMIGGALMFFPDDPQKATIERRLEQAGITPRSLAMWAQAAYPELAPQDAIRAYRRDMGRHGNDANGLTKDARNDTGIDYSPGVRRWSES